MAIVVGTNSWVTLAEADTYFSTRIGSAPWDALVDSDKEKYLITAYNWIYYDSAFNVPAASTETAVKYGQCEAALFLISYYTDMDKHDAMISNGIKRFKYGEREEDLGSITKPKTVTDFFGSVGLYSGGVAFFSVSNSETDY